jgi:hypothetical protein
LSSQYETLEAEKLNLVATVERKNQEIDRLNGELTLMKLIFSIPASIKTIDALIMVII